MGKVFKLSGALFLFLLSVGQLAAQSVPQVTLVKASRLLDPRTGNVLAPAAVLIEESQKPGAHCSQSGNTNPQWFV